MVAVGYHLFIGLGGVIRPDNVHLLFLFRSCLLCIGLCICSGGLAFCLFALIFGLRRIFGLLLRDIGSGGGGCLFLFFAAGKHKQGCRHYDNKFCFHFLNTPSSFLYSIFTKLPQAESTAPKKQIMVRLIRNTPTLAKNPMLPFSNLFMMA